MHQPPVSPVDPRAQINITTNPGEAGGQGGGGLLPYQPSAHNSHHPPPVYYPQTPVHAPMVVDTMAAPSPQPPSAGPPTQQQQPASKPKSHQPCLVTEDPILDASGAVIGGRTDSTKLYF